MDDILDLQLQQYPLLWWLRYRHPNLATQFRFLPGVLFILFFIIWVLLPVNNISLILSRVNRKMGRKREIPEKNHMTTRKQNLACLTRM